MASGDGRVPAFACSCAPNINDNVTIAVFTVVDSRGVQGGPGGGLW
jgi:hypothetical protein